VTGALGAAPHTGQRTLRRDVARYWLYAIWYAMACVAAAALWARLHHHSRATVWPTVAYLLVCGAALVLPGRLIGAGAVATRLSPRRHRALLYVLLVVSAGLVAGAALTGRFFAIPPFVLLAGNLIWSIVAELNDRHRRDEIAREATGLAALLQGRAASDKEQEPLPAGAALGQGVPGDSAAAGPNEAG